MGRYLYLKPNSFLYLIALLLQSVSTYAMGEEHARLTIVMLQGEGALNDITKRTAREPIVQVEDENHRPVAGATVVFTLPDQGPSGTFIKGLRVFSTTTDRSGKAIGTGFKPNQVAGQYEMHVSVSDGKSTSTTTISEQNYISGSTSTSSSNSSSTSPSASSSAASAAAHVFPLKLVLIGTAIAGGAAVGGVVAVNSRGSKSIVISTGGTTVEAPQAQRHHR
jgi:hypothetical protein